MLYILIALAAAVSFAVYAVLKFVVRAIIDARAAKELHKALEDDDTLERQVPPELLEMDRKRSRRSRIVYNHPPTLRYIVRRSPRYERLPVPRFAH